MQRLGVFLWGVGAAVGQVYLLREYLVAAGGNELCIGFFFAAWLLGIAAGAFAAGWISERRASVWLFVFSVLGWLIFPFAILALGLSGAIFGIPAGTRLPLIPAAILSLLTVFPFAALIGAYFPAASRFLSAPGEGGAGGVGEAYWIEGAGMAAGSLAATFLLVPHAGPVTAVWAVFSLVFLSFGASGRVPRGVRVGGLVVGACVLVLVLTGYAGRRDEQAAAARFAALKTGCARVGGIDTRYARYDLGRRGGQYALFINGQFAQSFPDEYTAAAKAHFFAAEADLPVKVLLLGAASFGLVPHLLEHGPDGVDYVETDPDLLPFLTRTAGERLTPTDPRVSVRYTDGRAFVKRAAPGSYDLVVADVPDPSTAGLNRYYTRNFFLEVKRVLRPGGVFVIGLGSSVTYLGEASASLLASVRRALAGTFPHVLVTPGERAYLFATARDGLLTDDWTVLRARYLRSGTADPAFVPEALASFLPEGQVASLAERLERESATANTDLTPVAYFHNLVLWDWTTGEGFSRRLARAGGLSATEVVLVLGVVFAVVALVAASRRRSSTIPAGAAVVTAGLFGMAAEVLCLFGFQNLQGALYSQVGFILALYMAGMTAGGLLGLAAARRGPVARTYRGAVVALAGCAGLAGAFPGLAAALGGVTGAAVAMVFGVFAAAAGGLSGFCFPAVASVFAAAGAGPGRTAAAVDALDCAGAAIGGLTAGAFLVPVTGLHGASFVLAAACLFAAAVALVPVSGAKDS